MFGAFLRITYKNVPLGFTIKVCI